ncbi:hypothetical protein [Macrococcus brunensis]|uniref:hypothetical protein n=1 Tax=Macrococcus brunensis TaxID=198483 RepID=UPI001EEF7C96|nr:hypothetical protein [Macrococcus brunensis]ULG74014.1 hypothetical protein MGG13_10255 [Macrococcus brunensis]
MENKKMDIKWGTLYRLLNFLVIILVILQFAIARDVSLFIILTLAALLITGLLDSLDHQRFRENKGRHIFDAVILALYTLLTYI